MVIQRLSRGTHPKDVRTLDFRESELRRAIQGKLKRLQLAKQRETEDPERGAGFGAPFDFCQQSNDLMAFGAMTAWEKRGGKPGADAWFSGINTSTEALEAIKSGRLTSLAGGHFITGAWTLVMIYDYHHGRDFADEGLELERSMFAEFTPPLAERYIQRFSNGFDSIDFSRYSKVKNPQLKRYNFGFAQLLEAKP